jgi:NADPH-dependent curcumin reductase CurA
MAPVGSEVQLTSYPKGEVRPTDFRIVEVEAREPGPGEVLVRNTWTSVDAGLRLRLREKGPEGYFVAFPLNAPMEGIMTVGEVVESRAEGFERGDTVWHAAGWRDYSTVRAGREALSGIGTLRRLDVESAPPQAYLGVVGGNGVTAYSGLFRVAGLKDGDILWVSAAAGAVGSLVVQMAKIRGNRVVGSAGSPEKVAYIVDELGADAAFDYHAGPVPELLREAAPDGIDVYFDNVGGDHLEAALGALRRWGRVAICGMISEYGEPDPPPGPRNLFNTVARDLTIRGFRGSSHVDLMDEMMENMSRWIREGRIKYRETVIEGLNRAPEALAGLMRGENFGKTIVRI